MSMDVMSVDGAPAPAAAAGDQDLLVDVRKLRKFFPVRGGLFGRSRLHVQAVNDITFGIRRGEVVGLVGESGSGKTTVGRTILRMQQPTSGEVIYDGVDLVKLPAAALREYRKRMQIIFQDPYSSLNPRMTVAKILGEALSTHRLAYGRERQDRIASLLRSVGLRASHMHRYPHEFSGGQRQRIGISRALAVAPEFIVADEPVSALDVSIQAQVVNLLSDLKETLGLTILFIAHDLAVVRHISDRVVVMYLGRIMEIAPANALYVNPRHPYTEALLASVPIPDPKIRRSAPPLTGDIPSPMNPPSGCVFRTRCPIAIRECAEIVPPLEQVAPDHFKACIRR